MGEVLVVVVEADEGEGPEIFEAVEDDVVEGLGGVDLFEVGFFVEELVDLVALGNEIAVALFLVVSFLFGFVVVVDILHDVVFGGVEEEDGLGFCEVREEDFGLVEVGEEGVDDDAFMGDGVAVLDKLVGFFLLGFAFVLAGELFEVNVEVAGFFMECLGGGGLADSWGSPEEDEVGFDGFADLLVDFVDGLGGVDVFDFSEFFVVFDDGFCFVVESFDSFFDGFGVVVGSAGGFGSF